MSTFTTADLIEREYTPHPPFVHDEKIVNKLKELVEFKKEERERIERAKHEPVTVVKIGRNEPCPCGSGKKYKKCCLQNEATS